jgi:hypothetical protein
MTTDDTLLNKITALMENIQSDGADNGEAMFLLGSAAADLADKGNHATWRDFKASLTAQEIIDYLRQIDTEGNRLLDEDKLTIAYALQVIGMSLATSSSDDPKLQQGAALLDDIVETTLVNFRNYIRTRPDLIN